MPIDTDNLLFLLIGAVTGLPAGYFIHFLIDRWKRRANARHAHTHRYSYDNYRQGEWKRRARLFLFMVLAGVMAAWAILFFSENTPDIYHSMERSAARSIIVQKTGKTVSDAELDRMIKEFREREGEENFQRLLHEYESRDLKQETGKKIGQ